MVSPGGFDTLNASRRSFFELWRTNVYSDDIDQMLCWIDKWWQFEAQSLKIWQSLSSRAGKGRMAFGQQHQVVKKIPDFRTWLMYYAD